MIINRTSQAHKTNSLLAFGINKKLNMEHYRAALSTVWNAPVHDEFRYVRKIDSKHDITLGRLANGGHSFDIITNGRNGNSGVHEKIRVRAKTRQNKDGSISLHDRLKVQKGEGFIIKPEETILSHEDSKTMFDAFLETMASLAKKS